MVKTVLIIHEHLIYGGAEKYTMSLANGLAERGVKVILVTGGGPLVSHLSPLVLHITLKIKRRADIMQAAQKAILKIAKQYQPDVIHTQNLVSMLSAKLVRQEMGIPLITHEHHMYYPEEYPPFVAELKENADQIITIGPYTASALFKHGIKHSKLTPILNGIDAKKIAAIKVSEKKYWRKYLGLQKEDKVIICISHLEEGKGIDKLVKAFVAISKQENLAKLIIVGDDALGKTLEQIKSMTEKHKLSNRLLYYPGEFDIRKFHAVADIFCYPALVKGMAVMEAMAAGLPVVGKRTDRYPLMVEHMVSGLMTEPSPKYPIDPAEITAKILYLLSRPDLSRSMGKAGRQKVKSAYTLERVITEVMRVYEETIDREQGSMLNISPDTHLLNALNPEGEIV